jgi:hypothetical protein
MRGTMAIMHRTVKS